MKKLLVDKYINPPQPSLAAQRREPPSFQYYLKGRGLGDGLKYFIFLLLFSVGFADYYHIYHPETIAFNQQYLATPLALYKKNNEYYEKIYTFKKAIKSGYFTTEQLITNIGIFDIQNNRIIYRAKVQNIQSELLPNNHALVKEKINKVLLLADINKDGIKELLFKNGKLRVGEINGDKVIEVASNSDVFRLMVAQYNYAERYSLDALQHKSADELAQLRFALLAKQGNVFDMLTKKDKEYVTILYNLENQKRREGLKDLNVQIPKQ